MLEITLTAVALIAVGTDLAFNKIYNPLTLFALLAGFTIHWFDGGSSGALLSLAAAILAGLIFLPFYALGGMAAGDIKLMAGCAAVIGWPHGILAAGLSLVCGTLLGVFYYCIRGGAKELIARYSTSIRYLLKIGQAYLPTAPPDSVARTRIPYALAIASGCLITQFLIVR